MNGTELLALIISIMSIVFVILNFFFSRKDKSNKDTERSSYNQGRLEEKVDNISKQLKEVLARLDDYEDISDRKIEKALENHVKLYHKGE